MYAFNEAIIESGKSYDEFEAYSERIVAKEITDAPYDKEFYYSYTVANAKRGAKLLANMQLNKKLYNELTEGIEGWYWILLDEPWCGDASFSVPVLRAMELAADGDIGMKIFLRDKHHEIMEHYLTNKGMAIPKLVCLNKDLVELGTWGPRPQALGKLVNEWKIEGIDNDEKLKRVHKWYRKDNSESIQKEFIDAIRKWKKADAR